MCLAISVSGCGNDTVSTEGEDFQLGVPDGYVQEITLRYTGAYVMSPDSLNGYVFVDVNQNTMTFHMKKGMPVTEECLEIVGLSATQVDDLKAVLLSTNYTIQNPVPAMLVADSERLDLEVDFQTYRIKVPHPQEEGAFILPKNACEIRTLLKQYVIGSGESAGCPQQVKNKLFATCALTEDEVAK